MAGRALAKAIDGRDNGHAAKSWANPLSIECKASRRCSPLPPSDDALADKIATLFNAEADMGRLRIEKFDLGCWTIVQEGIFAPSEKEILSTLKTRLATPKVPLW